MDIPKHIAIIMDGNGRWAKQKGLPRYLGHKRGMDRVREVISAALAYKVKALTLFAFSTENWKRPQKEVSKLFSYLEAFLKKEERMLMKEDIRLYVFGRRDRISKNIIRKLDSMCDATKHNSRLALAVALDFGGRWDIVEAAKKIANEVKRHNVTLAEINEKTFGSYLVTAGIGDPDLLIRTAHELRISNFLLWQLAYSELYFCDICWPDFTKKEFEKALIEYGRRHRRFGKVKVQ